MHTQVFVHFVNLPGAMYIAQEIFDSLVDSDLINNANFNIYCNYGYNEFAWLRESSAKYSNIQLFYPDTEPLKDFELPTILEIKKYCDNLDTEEYILYLHQKGATGEHTTNPRWISERKKLLDYNVAQWRKCIANLSEGYDMVGHRWMVFPSRSTWTGNFYGNIWWAKSSYLKTLPVLKLPSENNFESQLGPYIFGKQVEPRLDAELWYGLNSPKVHTHRS
jgi:hypothetical protein